MYSKNDSESRPRGRPKSGKPTKRTKTFKLSLDVCEYLATTDNQGVAIENAVRATKEYKAAVKKKLHGL